MSKIVEVTNSTWPMTGSSVSKKTARRGPEPEEERHDRAADGDRQARAEQAAGVRRRGGAQFVAAAREVAHDEREARDSPPAKPPPGGLWPAKSR